MTSAYRSPSYSWLERWGTYAEAPFYALALLSSLLYVVPSMRSAVHETPWLLFALNVIFVTPLCLWVSALALRSYLAGGLAQILFAGSGVFAFGVTNFISGFLISGTEGPNDAVTVHNLGMLSAAALHLAGCLQNLRTGDPEESVAARKSKAALGYGGIFAVTALVWLCAFYDLLPSFIAPGGEITNVRLVVLAASIVLFAVSALLIRIDFEWRRAPFLRWYGLGLALIALGLLGVTLAVPGSYLSWTGRLSQYVGNLYLFAAAVILVREARREGFNLARAVDEFFRRSDSHYRALVETSTSAIISADPSGRVILWNHAAGACFGYTPSEAAGLDLAGAIAAPESESSLRDIVAGGLESRLETTLRRKDGTAFPADLSCFSSGAGQNRATTLIIQDITERKRVEGALKASEARYRALAESSPDAVIVHRGGRFVYANEQALRLYGAASFSQLFSHGILELMHPDDRSGIRSRIQTVVDGERTPLREVRLLRLDGTIVATEAAGSPILFEGLPSVQVVIRDITERKQAEAAIIAREQQLRLVMDTVPALMSYVDTEFRYRRVNEEYERWFGMAAQDFEGRHVRDVLGEEAWQTVHPRLEQALSGETVDYEEQIHYRAGGPRWVHTTLVPDRDDSGRVRGFVGLVADITERKAAEEALREQTERYRLVVEGAHAAIWDWDVPNRRVFFSPQWKAMRGFAEDEISEEEKEWSERIHPEDAPRVHASLQAHFEGKTPDFFQEYRILCKDGTWKWIADRGVALRDDAGRVVRMAGSETDITERKAAEEALKESERRFRVLASASSEVLYRMSPDWSEMRQLRSDGFLANTESPSQAWLQDYILPADQPYVLSVIDEAIRTKSVFELEHRVRKVDGGIGWTFSRAVPLLDAEGKIIEWFGAASDVTERKRAEAAVQDARKSLERERDLLQSVMDGATNSNLAYLDRDFNFVRVNEAYATSCGHRPGELIGKNHFVLYPHAANEAIFARVRDTGIPVEFRDRPFVYSDQPERGVTYWDWTLTPIRDGAGHVDGLVLSLFETTERKRTEDALRHNEARFRLLSDTAGRLLAAEDPQGIVDALCRDVMEHLDCQAFFNFLVDERAGRLRLNACAGIPEDEVRKLEWLDYGVAVCGCVARDQIRIVAEDIFHTPDARTELVKSYGIQAYCCHPLMAGERLLGTLSFGTTTRAFFTSEEVELMKAVADQVSVAMERIRDRQVLRESEARLQAIVDNLPVGVWFADGTGKILYGNPAGQRIWSGALLVGPDEFHEYKAWWADSGKPLLPEDWAVARAVRTGETSLNEVLVIQCFDGSKKTILNSAVPFFSPLGDLYGVVVLNEDITERKAAEEAMHESEKRYRALFNEMSEGFALHEIVLDERGEPVDYRFLEVNPAFERATGLRAPGIVGKTVSEVLPGTEPFWIRTFGEVALTGKAVHFENHSAALGKDFEVFAYRPSAGRFAVIFLDITGRLRAERALRRSEEDLNRAQSVARTGSWRMNMQKNELTWSDENHRIFGIPKGTPMTYEAFLAIVHPDDRSYVDRMWMAALRGEPYDIEHRLVVDGEVKWVRETADLEFDAEGSLLGGFGTTQDITERKRAEEQMERLASFPLLNPNPVVEADLEGRVTFTNPAAWKIFPDLGKRGTTHPWLANWEALLESARGEKRHREVSVDGRWYHQSLQLVDRAPSLRIYGWDITGRKAAEEALRLAKEHLEERVRERTSELVALTEDLTASRDQLRALALELAMAEEQARKRIAVVLHDEVAQTLAAAKMRLDLLRPGGGDESSHRALTEARELLEQSIRETRALMTDISPPLLFDMGLAAACESLAEKMTARHGIPIRCDFPVALDGIGQEMRIVIFQIVRELLSNAVKHSGARNVRISVKDRGVSLEVKVTDDGVGFDPESLRGPTAEGGFGLFSIRERVMAFNGNMAIESGPESGTEVTISLPCGAKESPAGSKGGGRRGKPVRGKTP